MNTMVKAELEVTNPKGIHARPSAMIVETAQSLKSDVRLSLNGETVDAANIMDVLSLGAAQGAMITVTADGPDEEAALQRMQEIFTLNFNDDAD